MKDWITLARVILTYHIGPGIHLGKNVTGVGSGHHEVWNDGNGFDLRGPVELSVMTNAQRWLWRFDASVNSACRGRKDLTQRDLFARNIFRLEFIQICTHKSTKE